MDNKQDNSTTDTQSTVDLSAQLNHVWALVNCLQQENAKLREQNAFLSTKLDSILKILQA